MKLNFCPTTTYGDQLRSSSTRGCYLGCIKHIPLPNKNYRGACLIGFRLEIQLGMLKKFPKKISLKTTCSFRPLIKH